MELNVIGRGKLVCSAHDGQDFVVLRLDDVRNLEFWAEVRLTAEQLRELLRMAEGEK